MGNIGKTNKQTNKPVNNKKNKTEHNTNYKLLSSGYDKPHAIVNLQKFPATWIACVYCKDDFGRMRGILNERLTVKAG